jgi:2-dehydro-3-deoxyphosphogluconate aldolase/(4S)-4-hydroxy-2-oxoglutarate aldolase
MISMRRSSPRRGFFLTKLPRIDMMLAEPAIASANKYQHSLGGASIFRPDQSRKSHGGGMLSRDVCRQIGEIGVVPCARVTIPDHARFAAAALNAAGIPVLEVPLTVPQALEVIADLAKRYPEMIVGAGTVLDAAEARRAIDAGAHYITSPGFVPEVVAEAKRAGVAVFPGAITPSEVIAAWKAGADMVKIFPAGTAGGPNYVRALKVPLPQIPLIVTGGVNQMTAFDYILSGAEAIGVGSELLPKESLVRRQEDRIHELARRFLLMGKEARAQRDGC